MRRYDIDDIVFVLPHKYSSAIIRGYISEINQARIDNWEPNYKVIFIDKRNNLPKYGWYKENFIKMDLENLRNKKLNNLGL